MATYTKKEKDVSRRAAKFPPTIWGTCFASFSLQDSEMESYNKEVEALKGKLKSMLMDSKQDLIKNIEFIDLLCRLGVAYHFENDIEEQLNHSFSVLPYFLDHNDYDLYTAGLVFRVLRQHGHKVSYDIFNRFKEQDGEWKKTIESDVKGLLSLYEASFVNVQGEDILEEASSFSKKNLEVLASQTSPQIGQQIMYALKSPNQQGMRVVESRMSISFYQQDESMDTIILKFAVLDFSRLQLLYRQELALVSRWWEESKLPEKLPYSRDRIVEVYVWALGCLPHPKFSLSRLLVAKYTQMAMTIDDTYDVYGTLDELQDFTASFERCNIDAIDQLPEYMKDLYKAILKLFEETDKNDENSYKTSYAKEMFKELTRADMVEANWFHSNYMPTFDEYIRNAVITTTSELLTAAFFLGSKDVGMKEIIWVRENPQIFEAAKLFVRLYDDLATHEEERIRGDCPSAVECYMNQYGVSQEKAREELRKMITNIWKDINEAYMKPTRVSKFILDYFLNFARMSNFVYKVRDAYTYSTNLKTYVERLFLEKLPM